MLCCSSLRRTTQDNKQPRRLSFIFQIRATAHGKTGPFQGQDVTIKSIREQQQTTMETTITTTTTTTTTNPSCLLLQQLIQQS